MSTYGANSGGVALPPPPPPAAIVEAVIVLLALDTFPAASYALTVNAYLVEGVSPVTVTVAVVAVALATSVLPLNTR